jgi:DNA polymerase-3 subunit delta'
MAWNDILGQDLPKRLLQTHLAAEQVFSAYLLAGPEGVGKRRLAIEMAKALNCSDPGSRPCDVCSTCAQIHRGAHPDVHVVLPGGASDQIKIDEVRHLISRLALRPFSSTVQVAIVDGAERLTEEAANSLLKVLEEPPARTRFLLMTSRPLRCLPTIVSRCQLIRCEPLPVEAVRRILLDVQGCEPSVAEAVAQLSRGSASYGIDLAGRWTQSQKIAARLANGTPSTWMEQPLPETRQEVTQLLEGMMGWLRDLAVAAVADPARVVHAEHADALHRQARALDVDRCLETAFALINLRESLDQFVNPRLVATLAREKWLSLRNPDA